MIEQKWCYKCYKTYPLTEEYWYYTDGTHKRFKNKCKKCANYDSMISHRIHRAMQRELQNNK